MSWSIRQCILQNFTFWFSGDKGASPAIWEWAGEIACTSPLFSLRRGSYCLGSVGTYVEVFPWELTPTLFFSIHHGVLRLDFILYQTYKLVVGYWILVMDIPLKGSLDIIWLCSRGLSILLPVNVPRKACFNSGQLQIYPNEIACYTNTGQIYPTSNENLDARVSDLPFSIVSTFFHFLQTHHAH